MSEFLNNEIRKQTDEAILSIKERFKSGEDISVSLIQRKCRLGYNSASRAFEQLVSEGTIKRGQEKFGVSKYV